MIQKILEYNKAFVKEEAYKPYITSKYPDKKLAILTCMDARLTALLPAALGIKTEMQKSSKTQAVSQRTLTEVSSAAFWLPFWNLALKKSW